MNTVHFHLLLSHLPLAGVLFALLIWVMGKLGKREGMQQLSGWLLIFCAVAFIVLYITGEKSEEQVEHLAGFSHEAIENHEDAAKPVYFGSWLMLIVGLIDWWRSKKGKYDVVSYWVPVFSLAMLIMGTYAAWEGGKIRHSELHSPNPSSAIAPSEK